MSFTERYHRQIILKDFGESGQQKLLQARILVIGAGGLGCPALQYLTAAGVGTIGVVDDDVVTLSNLHRQTLFAVNDIGQSKAEKAVDVLSILNPDIHLSSFNMRLTSQNAAEIIRNYDIVLDGSDNFSTRYLVNDTCVLLDKILVYGAVSQYEGQVAIFNCKRAADKQPVNYRNLFPHPPANDEILNCEQAGVLGVVPGIIGTMMANETIKLITGIGSPIIGRLITYDARSNQLYEIELSPNDESLTTMPADLETLKNTNYEQFCDSSARFEINNTFFNELMQQPDVDIIDVREKTELPIVEQFDHLAIPLGELRNSVGQLKKGTIVLFCQSGKRSNQAASELHRIFNDSKKIFSLKGGIVQWLQQQKETV